MTAPVKYTTYMDNRRRRWVIVNLWYPELESTEIVAITIYRVDSDQELQQVEIDKWKEWVANKLMIPIK